MLLQHAVVAYVRNDLGRFVEDLRRQVHPEHVHLGSHLSILPPRRLEGSEDDASRLLRKLCRSFNPFEVSLGEVANFLPTTATVFLRISYGAYRMRELHDLLHQGALGGPEQWPYIPHLTLAKVDDPARAQEIYDIARRHWDSYRGSRQVLVDELTFVRNTDQNGWRDIAPVPLGKITKIRR
ncbi:MAG TPA: 2'-5' RNA ligase family protein [Terriglobales bacterium]|nr:2'-5' RNA ligase family protein [Terriglobales bacterium]